MTKPLFTYGLLDERLHGLGFKSTIQKGKARIYRHEASAKIILPDAPFEEEALPRHLAVVRQVLREHDLGELGLEQPSAAQESERNELAWRAFFLGMRVALASKGIDLDLSELPALVSSLHAIANSETTLHDPTMLASKMAGTTGEWLISFANQSIRADRQLAEKVVQGFAAATEVNGSPQANVEHQQNIVPSAKN